MTIAFHKPYGVLTGFTDPHTHESPRPTLAEYLDCPGLSPIGRLDLDSEGLLLLTDEARIARRLTAPGAHPKTYWVEIERVPTPESLRQFRTGVLIAGGQRTREAQIQLIDPPPLGERPVSIRFRKNVPTCWAEVILHEGKNRQVRRMTAAIGHPTLRLVRSAVGPIILGDLLPGQQRPLTSAEESWIRRL